MKIHKIRAIGVALFVAGAATLYAACGYIQHGPGSECSGNSNCSSYTTPIAVTCVDTGGTTHGKLGNTQSSTVTFTTYSGGTCEGASTGSPGTCTGGTQTGTSQGTRNDQYCTGCPK